MEQGCDFKDDPVWWADFMAVGQADEAVVVQFGFEKVF